MQYLKVNNNPKGKKCADCVVRAISRATGKSWEEVLTELTELALKVKAMPSEKAVYDKYLEQHGFMKMKQPRKSNGLKYKVGELDAICKSKVMIISMANHITVCIDGVLEDTWDCRRKTIGNFYVR